MTCAHAVGEQTWSFKIEWWYIVVGRVSGSVGIQVAGDRFIAGSDDLGVTRYKDWWQNCTGGERHYQSSCNYQACIQPRSRLSLTGIKNLKKGESLEYS